MGESGYWDFENQRKEEMGIGGNSNSQLPCQGVKLVFGIS